jgi:hypothetical protein
MKVDGVVGEVDETLRVAEESSSLSPAHFSFAFSSRLCQADRVKSLRAFLLLLLLVWGAAGLFAKPVDAFRSSRGYDDLGSVRYLADDAGLVVDKYTYDAFGLLTERKAPTSGGTWALFEISQPETSPSYKTVPTPRGATVNAFWKQSSQAFPLAGAFNMATRQHCERPGLMH